MSTQTYDVVIIGGGPGGLTAGLYAARARLRTLLIEKDIIGGNIVNAESVENFPGFPDGINGYDLTQLMHQQATKFGLETRMTEVKSLQIKGLQKTIDTGDGSFAARTVIVAGGSISQKLGAPGEKEFTGRGVSYCATCDAAFFNDQPVAVVGGGNAAIQEAVHLTKFASSVALVHRRAELRATKIEQERAFAQPKMTFVWNSVVDAIEGKDTVERVRLHDVKTGKASELVVKGVFVAIGFTPNTAYLKGLLPLDDAGYIVTDDHMETDVPGIFAAGDIRSGSMRQVVTACGDGATAAMEADRYLEHNK